MYLKDSNIRRMLILGSVYKHLIMNMCVCVFLNVRELCGMVRNGYSEWTQFVVNSTNEVKKVLKSSFISSETSHSNCCIR